MKKIALTLTGLLLTTTLSASPQERQSDMVELSNGMGLIMNGLLYNYIDNIKLGTAKIKRSVARIQSHDLKKYLPSETAYAYKFGEKSLRRINEYAQELQEAADAKDFEGAFESSVLLMRQCNSCHSRVRSW